MAVYFAHADGRIKVGVTSKPVNGRLAQISASLPKGLDLIAAIPGDRRIEQRIHGQLSAYHLNGEWFRDCEPCRKVVSDIVEISRAATIAPEPPSPEKTTRSPIFGRVCKAIWPHKTAEELAAKVGCNVRTAAYEISGERHPSAQSLMVVLNEMVPKWK